MDKQQFESFYTAYLNRIYRFVFYRVGGNKELTQDLTQEIFIKAFEAFERYDPTISQSSWIYTIARNHIINNHAKQRPTSSLEDIEGTVWASRDAREQFATHHDERALLAAIAQLSPEDARLVRMKYLEGWAFDDLSECLEKTSVALRVQATRAIKKLRKLLKDPHAV